MWETVIKEADRSKTKALNINDVKKCEKPNIKDL